MTMASDTSQKVELWTNQTLTYVAVALGVIVMIKYLMTPRYPDTIPPFPARSYPLLGHLPYFRNGVRKQLQEWTDSTGEMFSLYFGSQLVVILSSYEAAYDAFVKHGDTLSDRPVSFSADTGGMDHNKGLAMASGRVWKEQRAVTVQILKSFGVGKNILASKVSEEVSAYLSVLSDFCGRPCDTRLLNSAVAANVICSIIVGQRFEYDDTYFMTFMEKFEEWMKLCESATLFTVFPWLRHLPGDLFNAKKRIGIFRYILDEFCYPYIEKTKKEGGESGENFISAYLQEEKKLKKGGKDTTMDDENLARNILAMFAAGGDSTGSGIQWFMLHMLHHPDVQNKIFSEISDVVGLERPPNMYDKVKLNFTNAAIFESQRLGFGPLNVPRECREDTVVRGYTIPAGTSVISSFDSIMLNPDIWEDPLTYTPERFLDAQGKFSPPEQYAPFGIGRRSCPGEPVAKMVHFLTMTSLIQRFELQPAVPGELPSLTPRQGVVFSPQPFKLRFVDRRGC